MTMATGELGYDDIFRQSTTNSISTAPDVPFPAISYIMWVIFIILMPVLFTNLLVGLTISLIVIYLPYILSPIIIIYYSSTIDP